MQAQRYTVTLAGVKSSAASDTTGYNVIVIGGPVYAGRLTISVKDTLNSILLSHDQGVKVGIFGSGQGATSPDDIAQIRQSIPARSDSSLSEALVVKIGSSEEINTRAQDFVNQLLT